MQLHNLSMTLGRHIIQQRQKHDWRRNMDESDQPSSQETEPEIEELPPLTFLQMLGSTFSAAFGVQSQRNRERDFSRGKAGHFILMGIGFTAAFVITIVLVVKMVLAQLT